VSARAGAHAPAHESAGEPTRAGAGASEPTHGDTSGPETAAVEVRDLSRTFGDFIAVDKVSFRVAPREIFGFLGPNGAGKTTTIKMLTGLLPPTSGSGQVAGFTVGRDAQAIRERIGYMSQLFSLYGDLTVEENISFFSGLYGVPRERRAERRDWVLAMAGLEAERKRATQDLPLGFKQRLALGCAVLHEPPILFLDEPTSGVDPLTRRSFWQLIDQLTQAGTTVFVTTHYMEEAESCDRLALMNRGRLIALDTPAALRREMREPLFELTLAEPLPAIAVLKGSPGVRQVGMFGRALHVALEPEGDSSGDGAEARLRRILAERGLDARSLRPIVPSLEDVFISLVSAAGGAPED
jgi:drug efflux transport system ATP-binding protein